MPGTVHKRNAGEIENAPPRQETVDKRFRFAKRRARRVMIEISGISDTKAAVGIGALQLHDTHPPEKDMALCLSTAPF